jgi:phosphoribosylaminoimidazole-succinocarboxamide synthase
MSYSLLYQGSVKNLYHNHEDVLFEYSDRYSLFDWGEMPDDLDKKGEALALMGALFFKEIEELKIPHHFLSLADKEGNQLDWKPTRYLKVKEVPVIRPAIIDGQYDYSFYQTRPQHGLVPLEVMFRFGIGKGSSVTKRVEANPDLLKQWDMDQLKTGELRDFPLIDFSTKLEKGDRYLTHIEAKKLASLTDAEFNLLTDLTTRVAIKLRSIFQQMGLELWDGKLEWAFTPDKNRGFMLVDSIGLDELRLEKNGISLSKEFLREYYRSTPWFEKLKMAKDQADKTGADFKTLCTENPPALPSKEKNAAIHLYQAFTNDLAQIILGNPLFEENLTLKNWQESL